MLPQKFPFNRHPYCVTFRFLFCCSSNMLLIRGNSFSGTKSTQLQARLNNAFGRQLTKEYIGYKNNIIFIWKGFLSWLICRYLQVRWTWMLPWKLPFNRHPYCVTFRYLFCCSANTLLIRISLKFVIFWILYWFSTNEFYAELPLWNAINNYPCCVEYVLQKSVLLII